VEQERAIKENELNTEIAVENKKRQIRETQMEADAKAYGLSAMMKALSQSDAKIIQALANVGMDPAQLVANVLKYLTTQTVIGVNPDPRRWEGVLLPFGVGDLHNIVPGVFVGKRAVKEVTMAKATLNTGETLYGVNDLFIGPKTHSSARYSIRFDNRAETQSSSGIIVSTGLGATGWFRVIITGAAGIATSLSPETETSTIYDYNDFLWNSDYLFFSVREPWPSKTSSANIVFGKITPDTPLTLVSQMPENGVIFSDGIEADFNKFNSGTCAAVSVAEKKGRLAM
jgi:hypothetical protein